MITLALAKKVFFFYLFFFSSRGGHTILQGDWSSDVCSSDLVDLADVRQVFADHEIPPDQPTVTDKVKTLLVGKPLDLSDRRVYQHISLVAFLAWVGLG